MAIYLAHHGILGQKWGKRNGPPYPLDPNTDYSEAEKRADQKRRYKSIKKNFDKNETFGTRRKNTTSGVQEDINSMASSKPITDALDKLKNAGKPCSDFYHDREKVDKYKELAARVECKLNGTTDPDEINHWIEQFKWSDMDQGTGNSWQIYCLDNNISKDVEKKWFAAHDDYENTVKSMVNEYLGKYGDKKVQRSKYTSVSAKDVVADAIEYLNMENNPRSPFFGDQIEMMSSAQEPKYREALKEVKREMRMK